MLVRATICSSLVFVSAQLSLAGDQDHLQRGEPELKYDHDVKYDRFVHRILFRGWKSDVVLRTLALPPFNPEAVLGLLGRDGHYLAFVVRPSNQIWEASGLGGTKPHIQDVWPIFHSRPISDSLAARIAAVYRHVLTDRRNYSRD